MTAHPLATALNLESRAKGAIATVQSETSQHVGYPSFSMPTIFFATRKSNPEYCIHDLYV